MEVYGDLKDGYIEFTLWHERLSDLVVYMRPLNYPWQILWKVWNTSEAVNATVTIKRDLFGTDGNVEDIEALIPHEYFYAWKDWEIIVYDMEKGCEGKLESVKLEFGVATRVVSGDTDNDGLSDAYESEKIPVIAMDSVNPGTTMYSQPFSLPHYTHNCEVAVGYASYSPPNPPQDWPKATVKLQRQVPNTGTYLTVDT
ncbi:MAG: hypothetical protein N3F63_07405, partial [Thermoplasmata archaeon]|nr:hypothetical protein [Thermoplasmata archaeon]